MKVHKEIFEDYLETLRLQDMMITEFNEALWHALIDRVTVCSDNKIEFTFRDGTVIIG